MQGVKFISNPSMYTGEVTYFIKLFALLLTLAANQSWSQTSDFANCNSSKTEMAQSKEFLSDEGRISLLSQVSSDIARILEENQKGQSPYPPSLLRTCLANKRQTFEEALKLAPDSVRAKAGFLRVLGFYSSLIGRDEVAYKSFLEASNKEASDYSSRLKAFDSFLKFKMGQLQTLTQGISNPQKPISSSDLEAVLGEAERILEPLMQSQVPRNLRIEAHTNRAQLIEKSTGDYSRSVRDWKAVVDLDPQNARALRATIAHEKSRGLKGELKKYLLLLLKIEPKNSIAASDLFEIYFSEKDSSALMREGITQAKNFPEKSKLQAYYSWGLLQEGEIEKADAASSKALQLNPKNELAKNVKKSVLVTRAQKYSQANQISKALELYGEAQKLDSKDFEISKSTALMIFDFYKSESSKNQKAFRSDMQKVTKLLLPVLKNENLEATSLLVLIEATRHSNQSKAGTQACQVYEKNFGSLKISDRILDCAKMWVSVNKKELAKDLLQRSLNQGDLEGPKEPLSQYLLKLL